MATILVVDDRPSNRQFLTTLLGYGGHVLLEAGDGAQALELVRKERPHLVVTDILMPTMDGYEFVQQLRADAELADTPVIFYTASYSTPQAEALAKSCGVHKVLSKPAEPQDVLDAVNQALGVRRTALPAAPKPAAAPSLDDSMTLYLTDLEEVRARFEDVVKGSAKLRSERQSIGELSKKFADNVAAMQRVTARLSGLLEVGMEMMTERDPARLVELFFAAACDLIDSDYAAVGMLDKSEQAIQFVFAKGFDAGLLSGAAGREGLLGTLLSGQRTLRLSSADGKAAAEGLPPGHPPVRDLLGLPVASAERVYGWIYFADSRGGATFGEEDARVGTVMTRKLALLYENAMLYDEIQRHAAQLQLEIGERRRTQTALAQSEAGLHRAQLMAKLAHVITGPDGSFERWSETLPQLAGVEPSQLPRSTRAWLDLLHPEDQPMFRAKAIEAGARHARADVEYRLRRADGEWISVRQTIEPLKDEGGAASGWRWFNTLQDVTQQVRAESDLRGSEAKFRTLIEQAADGIFVTDSQGQFLLANSRYCEMLGYSEEELLSMNVADTFPEAERAQALQRIPQLQETKNRLYERRMHRKDSSSFPAEISVRAIGDGTHQGIARDITARKAAEDRIKRLNRVYAVLSHINSLLVRMRDRDELFREASRIAVELGEFRMAWIGVVDPDAGIVKPVAVAGDVRDFFASAPMAVLANTPGGHGLSGRAVREMKPMVSNDVKHDPQRLMRKELDERGINSLAVIPLIVGGEAIGVLALYAGDVGFFDDEEMKLLSEVASNIAFALEHIDKEEKVKRLTRVHAVLSGINALIVRVRDRDELFREACHIAIKQGQFRMAWIGLLDHEIARVKPLASDGDVRGFFDTSPLATKQAKPTGKGLAWRAVEEKRPMISNDIQRDPNTSMKKECEERGIHSLVMLPLIVGGEGIGVLALYAAETGFFDDDEMKLLVELAGDVSFALDHLQKAEKLNYLAYYDELTGVANRALLEQRLAQQISGAERDGRRFALLKVDLDRFRVINDSLGRPGGDALLKKVSERLVHAVPDANDVARIGADRFVILVADIKQEDELARLIRHILKASFTEAFQINDVELRVSAKIGAALYPDNGSDVDSLFKNAEAALKKAKQTGEPYLFYEQQMSERVAEKLSLENKLRQAIEKEEFVLYYQPKVDLETRAVVGVEALIRWQSPDKGLVPPLHFIPLLEETGLILQVGEWALKRAARDHRGWVEQKLKAPRVAVNVSAIQLRQRDFVRVVEEAIIDGVAPTAIDLEITESLVMEDIKGNIEKLKAVRALGVQIAVDDFGTGYSSLGYLAQLPVQALKIDRSFIIKMGEDPNAMTLVSTIISLAHSLRLKVVAEGVETEDQAKFLRLLRCDEMQGYLFSKPVPAEQLIALLKAG
ncbi:MAG TPA: EAL domain-containing protein [Burkholderiales bacterium]